MKKPKAKVLIVDDDYSFAEFAQMLLESSGYPTVVCLEGKKALESALTEKPDVILTDLGMPDVDGIEVIKRLKADPGTKEIPILVCSITHNGEEIQQALDSGGAGFVAKPLNRQEIADRIDKLADG